MSSPSRTVVRFGNFEAELRLVVRNRCVDTVPDSLRERVARAIQEAD